MCKKKMVSKGRVVFAGLLMLAIFKTYAALAYPAKSDTNDDTKINTNSIEVLKTELARDKSPLHNIDIPRNRTEILQRRQDSKFDTGYDNGKGGVTSYTIAQKKLKGETVPSTIKRKRTTPPTKRKKSVASQTKRFKDNRDGTVTDSKTDLMWTKNANIPGDIMTFYEALDYIEGMNEGKYPNFGYTDWRLPTSSELQSLIDYTRYTKKGHRLPTGHRFQNVQSLRLNDEKSISYLSNSEFPRFFSFYCRIVGHNVKSCYGYVWLVRSLPHYDRQKRSEK